MTGAVQAAAGTAAASAVVKSVTIGTDGNGAFGYANVQPTIVHGGISSDSVAGTTILIVRSISSNDLGIAVANTAVPQSFFNRIVVQDSSGALRTYTSASASYASGIWTWGTGSNRVWTALTPSPRSLAFYF